MLPAPEEILVSWPRPEPAVVWRAIEIYLAAAYGKSPLPAAVQQRLDQLPRGGDLAVFYACPAFERIGSQAPDRYALRLGNSLYPHMKMCIGPTPGGDDFLFRADTHDRHVRVPPESPEYAALCEMLARNHAIGTAIEAAWESAGLPTFKQYLRQDLPAAGLPALPPFARRAAGVLATMTSDEPFMREAIAEAQRAAEAGEVPIGCVIVHDATAAIIGRGGNRRLRDSDPTAHAEIIALRQAGQWLKDWRILDCTIYVTLEPCPMCAGAMVNARVPRLVYGCADPKAGAVNTLFTLCQDSRLNHRVAVRAGVLADECAGLLRDFFAAQRALGKK